MRMVIVTDAWEPQVNGVVTTMRNTARNLADTGHEVTLITPDKFRSVLCPGYREIRLSLFPRHKVARILDEASGGEQYSDALAHHQQMIHDTGLTPSAIMLAEMRERGEGFYAFANRMSQTHKRYFEVCPLNTSRLAFLQQSVVESIQQQKEIEASDSMDFAEFMQWYARQ